MVAPLRSRVRSVMSNAILDAAEAVLGDQLLASGGAPTMAVIAERAGLSVGSLYNYFKDREELLTKLKTTRIDQFHASLDGAIAATAALRFRAQFETFVRTFLGFYDQHRNFFCIMFGSMQPEPKITEQRQLWLRCLDSLRPIIERGIAEGELCGSNADLYGSMLMGLLYSLMLERLDDDTTAFLDYAPRVLDVVLYGARVKPTAKTKKASASRRVMAAKEQ